MQVKIEAMVANGQSSDLFSIDTLPHFEVLEQSKIDTTIIGDRLQLSRLLTITSWDSGQWEFPTVIKNGTPSEPILIHVNYTSPWDSTKPYHDIKGIVPVKNPGTSTWWWYVIGAALLVALFFLFFPEGKKDKTVSELDSNAYKKAMQQLNKLESENIASVNVKQYYTELIMIFRTYLKGAKGIQSFSKTTDDLSIQLQALKMPQQEYNNLLQALRLSDLVKFAQYRPEEQMVRDSFNTIKESITSIESRNAV